MNKQKITTFLITFSLLLIGFVFFLLFQTRAASFTISLQTGWNMISLPVNTTLTQGEIAKACELGSSIWHYNPSTQQYQKVSTFTPGFGYWIKVKSPCTITIEGEALSTNNLPELKPGWNQVSALSESVSFSEIQGDCDFISDTWKYNPSSKQYEKTYNLQPGSSYWMKVEKDCQLYAAPPDTITCEDGTIHSKCSSDQPKLCVFGKLFNKCTVCDCPEGQNCNIASEECYDPKAGGSCYGSYDCSTKSQSECYAQCNCSWEAYKWYSDLSGARTVYQSRTECNWITSTTPGPSLSYKCPDIDGDGIVNIVDITFVSTRINTESDTCVGDPKYDSRGDMNKDNCLTIQDVEFISSYFGQQASEIIYCNEGSSGGCWGIGSSCDSECRYSSAPFNNFYYDPGCSTDPCSTEKYYTGSGFCSSTGSGSCYKLINPTTAYTSCTKGVSCGDRCAGSYDCSGEPESECNALSLCNCSWGGGETCSDGTGYGQCSEDQPKFCDNGNLIDACGPPHDCGCSSEQLCNEETGGCYDPSQTNKCSDGTPDQHCSEVTIPLFCDQGDLVANCQECDCPEGTLCQVDGTCAANHCVSMKYSGDPADKMDLVVLGSGLDGEDYGDLGLFASDAAAHTNAILSTEPFSTNSNKFNVWRINKLVDLGCSLSGERIITCAAPSSLISQCPFTLGQDKILIIVNTGLWRGTGGYAAIATRPYPTIMVHEFGHTFGGLPDHYVEDPGCSLYHCRMCSASYPYFGSPPDSKCACLLKLINIFEKNWYHLK